MFKKLMAVFLGWMVHSAIYSAKISVFISFSMPHQLLEDTLKESVRLKIPVYLNGLYRDSMPETVRKIMELSKEIPNLNLQIDPTLFERFSISQVPALVVEKGKSFDVIYGNLTLEEGLRRIAGRKDSGFSELEARRVSGE